MTSDIDGLDQRYSSQYDQKIVVVDRFLFEFA